ncbi:hypothetical protein OsI_38446 [Oryza sativa Indica Group]|uniref:Uncharacterized protein n=1 Tax=Oryza sativa subsp. indica TaxID=39946 RepID=B8BPU2_ORYSI|nr:hypothetical protein OsI_38446 [Oryza sativa Indica Group]
MPFLTDLPAAPNNSRVHPPLLACARRNKSSWIDADADAEPNVITIGRPGKKSNRRRSGGRKGYRRDPKTTATARRKRMKRWRMERDVAIPEVVTNRMMQQVGVSVRALLAVGVAFLPAFYYLKKAAKVDVPTTTRRRLGVVLPAPHKQRPDPRRPGRRRR